MTSSRSVRRLTIAVALILGASIVMRASQGPGGGGGGAQKPIVPIAASTLAAFPAAYLGETVSMGGNVERQLSPTVFTVDEDPTKALPADVLVIAPSLSAPVTANLFVNVIGEAIAFDPAEVAKRLKGYTLDMPADLIATYRGKPVVLATAVVTNDLHDLTKKQPAPMTPDDVTLSKIMKQVGPASTALRAAATASDAAGTHARAVELKKLFAEAQVVFTARHITDATGWIDDAIKLIDAADAGAGAAKWADVTAAATSLNRLCASCHAAHREQQTDGTYRLKTS